MAHWKGVWRFCFLSLNEWFKCTPRLWTSFKKNYLRWFHLFLFSDLFIFFLRATVTCCGSCGSYFWTWQQGKLSFIQTQRELFRCRFKGTFCADTCWTVWTVCSDSCFPSCAVEVKTVSSHACLQPTGVGFWRDFNLLIIFIAELSEECNTEQTFISE